MTGLKAKLKTLIEAGGPLPVSAYMNTCLHDPEFGYYATRPGIGRDFITAPEISQVFGELLGLWSLHEWQALGGPDPFDLIEVGAGRGTMMSDMMRAITQAGGGDAFRLAISEASPVYAAAQGERLSQFHPDFLGAFRGVGERPFLLLGNEWLDCLPARQFVQSGNGWQERVVGLDERGELAFGLATDKAPAAEGEQEGGDLSLPGQFEEQIEQSDEDEEKENSPGSAEVEGHIGPPDDHVPVRGTDGEEEGEEPTNPERPQ